MENEKLSRENYRLIQSILEGYKGGTDEMKKEVKSLLKRLKNTIDELEI